MYKAIIMDDDPIVRKGLQTMIDWEAYGFEICGSSRDGQEGLEQIERFQPDLVLTDIQMPGMNGLEMLHRVRDRYPAMQVIIVTGFRNFDYAREALQLGALEILLKPTRLEDLQLTVEKAAGKLRQQESKEQESRKIRQEHEEHHLMLAGESLRNLALGLQDYSPEEEEKLKKLGTKLLPSFILMADYPSSGEVKLSLHPAEIVSAIQGAFSGDFSLIPFQQNPHRSAFLLTPHGDNSGMDEIKNRSDQLISEFEGKKDMLLSMAISSPLKSWEDLRNRYNEAESLMGYRFLYGSDRLLSPQPLKKNQPQIDTFEEQQKELLEKIKKGDLPRVRAFFQRDDLFWSYRQEERELKRRFVGILNHMHQIREFYELSLVDEWDPVQMIDRIMHALTVDQILNSMIPWVISCTEEIYCILNQEKSDYVERAKEFMKENYREDITLQQTADYACVSIFYLSRLFKQNEGISFNSYLNRVRMDEAKQLLINTRLKAYEIGEKVGIPDPYYFSKLFKKMEGVTPSQFRKEESMKA